MTEKTFLSKDGKNTIHYYVWEPDVEPAAILQIVHGMAEHVSRYEPLAKYLNSYGILVCGHDHIGHGASSKPEDWGYMGEENGWKIMVQDVEQLHGIMKVQYMDTPYFILGHSMGSFITRAWLAMYGSGVDGAIIMGTAGTNPALGAAKFLCKTIRKSKGSRHLSKLITNAAFGSYNKRIKPERTPYDWLTRDESIVDRYIEDPACGFTFTVAGYADLFNVIGYVSDDKWYRLVPKDLPLLLVAGREDPVGAYGAGPAEVAEKLQNAGCSDVSLILYEDMRHEILNEYGKETVMEDIRRFVLGEEAEGAEDEPEEAQAPEAPEEPVAVTVEEAAAEIKEKAEEVREIAAEAAGAVKGEAEEVIEAVKEKTEKAAEVVKEKAEEAAAAVKDKAEAAIGSVKKAAGKVDGASRQLAGEADKAAEEARWKQSDKSFSQVIKAAEAIGPAADKAHSQAEKAAAKAVAQAEKAAAKAQKPAEGSAKAADDEVWVDLSRRDTLTAEALGRKIAADLAAKADK